MLVQKLRMMRNVLLFATLLSFVVAQLSVDEHATLMSVLDDAGCVGCERFNASEPCPRAYCGLTEPFTNQTGVFVIL